MNTVYPGVCPTWSVLSRLFDKYDSSEYLPGRNIDRCEHKTLTRKIKTRFDISF